MTTPITIFYSYDHADEALRKKLEQHLSVLQQQGIINQWYDRQISAGASWADAIDIHINAATIILLLVSPDFIASDYCYGIEIQRVLERHNKGNAIVIPVILRPVDWQGVPFAHLKSLPSNAKPVTKWKNRDEAFLDIAKGIRKVIEKIKPSVILEEPKRKFSQLASSHPVNPKDILQEDWGEAPRIPVVYDGYEKELTVLLRWTREDRCQVIAILGIAGVGKTLLATKLAKLIKEDFDFVIWRTLRSAPPLHVTLTDCLQVFFKPQHIETSSISEDEQMLLLYQYLQKHRCLVVLDNFESVFNPGYYTGQYRDGFIGYGNLIQTLGTIEHRSCLLLTSREKPKEISRVEGRNSSTRSLTLLGRGSIEIEKFLRDEGLFGSAKALQELTDSYSGNFLALKYISKSILEIFQGDIDRFLEGKEPFFGDIFYLLDYQFNRLSEQEQDILRILANGPMSLDNLQSKIDPPISRRVLLETIESLKRRFIIYANSDAEFTTLPMFVEYLTCRPGQ